MQQILNSIDTEKILQTLSAFSYYLYFIIRNSKAISQSKALYVLFCFNLLTFYECFYNPLNVIVVACVLHLTREGKVRAAEKLVGYTIVCVMEPIYVPVLVLAAIEKGDHGKKVEEDEEGKRGWGVWIEAFALLSLALISIFWFNSEFYFGVHFTRSSGPMWILYSHMFQSYLLLYQSLMTLTPFLILFPLLFILSISSITKIAILYFISTFVSPSPSLIHLWGLYYLEGQTYASIMKAASKRQQVIWNTLTLMMSVISLMSYGICARIINMWENSHMVSVGYFLVQILLFWGVHAVYLSESLLILEKEEQESRVKIKDRIKNYFKEKIKNL